MQDHASSVGAVVLGLSGFRLLAAMEEEGELFLLVETTTDVVGCPGLWHAGSFQGAPVGSGAGSACGWSPGPAGVAETGVAVSRARLSEEDLDGTPS